MGTTWVYDVTYGDEVTVWTTMVSAVAADTFTTSVTFEPSPIRVSSGLEVTVIQADAEYSLTTLDELTAIAGINMFGMDIIAYLTDTYTGDHGSPYSVDKSWTASVLTHLDPPMQPDSTTLSEVKVVDFGPVTVPAGTYDAYQVDFTLVEVDGWAPPPELTKTEWFSPQVGRFVKSVNYTGYGEQEVQELKSFTP